jgi:hypothetical protein
MLAARNARRGGSFVSQPVLAAAPFNWRKVLSSRPHVPPFLSEFAAEAAAAAAGRAPARAAAAGAAGAFAGLNAAERQQRLMGEVSAVITNLLGTGARNEVAEAHLCLQACLPRHHRCQPFIQQQQQVCFVACLLLHALNGCLLAMGDLCFEDSV